MKRGILIAIEGCDRCGKTTQTQRILDWFHSQNLPCQLMKFPDRTTPIGQSIDHYLKGSNKLPDESIHLLFSANRWERAEKLRQLLSEDSCSVILDRYAFSGVAYSSAKGLSLDWCKSSDRGLPKPDVVLYLDMPPQTAMLRGGYGEEKYENLPFQTAVHSQFEKLVDDSWVKFDASQDQNVLHSQLIDEIQRRLATHSHIPLEKLWI